MRRAAAAVLTSAIGLVLVVFGLGSPAYADNETVLGILKHKDKPVQGVEITVETAGGKPVGETTTDAKGTWKVPVPGEGTYKVTLNEETLPEGVGLRFPDKKTLTVQVFGDQQRAVLFALGEGTRDVQTPLEQSIQLTVEGLQFGLIIAMAAIGLSLIFGTTGLVNFAHGELVSLGAIVAFWFNAGIALFGVTLVPALHLILAGLAAVIVCGLLGGVQDRILWAPLRRRGTGLIAMMVVTIGLSIALRSLLLYLFKGSSRTYAQYAGQAGIDFGPFNLAPKAIVSVVISVAVLVAVGLALLKTRIGKATRAVSDNPSLAAASGIDVERVIRVVWVVGGALAALGGVLLGMAQGVNFNMGFQILLLVFAGVILGGLGTAFGALVGSLVVGVFVQVSTLWVPPELKYVGALLVLIVILLIRPQGILGRRERVG